MFPKREPSDVEAKAGGLLSNNTIRVSVHRIEVDPGHD